MKSTNRTTTEIQDILEVWIPGKLLFSNTPGLSIAIGHKGNTEVSSFGYADLKTKLKIKQDSQFRVASMSKMFTAVALMQLQEQKLLSIDDLVSQHIPWFKDKKIAIRDIMSHGSGIFRDGDTDFWQTGKFPRDLKKSTKAITKIFKPRKTFKYSNYGYAVLGEVIERVSGKTYTEYTTENIIKPLGLKNTHPDLPRGGLKGLVSGHHKNIPGKKGRVFPHYVTNVYASATGFISTSEDISKFLYSQTRERITQT